MFSTGMYFEFSRLFKNNNKNFPPFSNLAEMLNFLFFCYSDSPSIVAFMETVTQKASEKAMSLAWRRERTLVKEGFTGYGDWTSGQKSELLAKNSIRGFEAVEIQPHLKYPHMVRDESNFGFVSETLQQRRRKNRHGKSRKYA